MYTEDSEVIDREREAFVEGLARAYELLSGAGFADAAEQLDTYVWTHEAEMEYPKPITVTHPKSGTKYRWNAADAVLERWDSRRGFWKTTRYDPDFILDLAGMIEGTTKGLWEE